MKITVVPSSPLDPTGSQYLTTFLVDNSIAIDAGALGLYGAPREQMSIENVFLTHSHADHVGSLPIFLENTGYWRERPVTIYGSDATLASLRRDVFNDRVWPDLTRLETRNGFMVSLRRLEPECPVLVDGFRVTAVPVTHVVPTFGYLIEGRDSAVVFGADSGPTSRLWEIAVSAHPLRAAFIECTFPDALKDHARRTGHLCPTLLAEEATKLPSHTKIIVVHMRPSFRTQVEEQLLAHADSRIRIARGGAVFDY